MEVDAELIESVGGASPAVAMTAMIRRDNAPLCSQRLG